MFTSRTAVHSILGWALFQKCCNSKTIYNHTSKHPKNLISNFEVGNYLAKKKFQYKIDLFLERDPPYSLYIVACWTEWLQNRDSERERAKDYTTGVEQIW